MKMIIEIDNYYEKELLKQGIPDDVLIHIHRVLESAVQGNSFLRASFKFFEFLKNQYGKCFSKYARNYLNDVCENYTVLMSEAKSVPTLLMICNSGFCDLSCNSYARIEAKDIPKHIQGYLYCENSDDSSFFKIVFDRVKYFNHPISLMLDSYSGGNTNIIENEMMNNEKIFFCVSDSDVKYPRCKRGSTAEKIEKLFISKAHKFSCNYVLNVHEKENLFPYSLKNEIVFENDVEILLTIVSKSGDDVKHYFDIKDGVSKKNRKEKSKIPEWNQLYVPIMKKMQRKKAYHSRAGSTVLIRGIGSNGLSKILGTNIDFSNYFNHLTAMQKQDYIYVFDQMIRFGYGYVYSYS